MKKQVSYVESDDEGDDGEDIFKPLSGNADNRRTSKRQRLSVLESDDEFDMDDATQAALLDQGEFFDGPFLVLSRMSFC